MSRLATRTQCPACKTKWALTTGFFGTQGDGIIERCYCKFCGHKVGKGWKP